MSPFSAACAAVAGALMIASQAVGAQSIADRVGQVKDGKVRMSFASRPEVCGNGEGNITIRSEGDDDNDHHVIVNGNNWMRSRDGDIEWENVCEQGPVRVVMTVHDGRPTRLRSYVGGKWRVAGAEVADLGMVSVKAATDYLLALAAKDEGRAGKDAIFPATLADSVELWPQLVKMARSDDIPTDTRKQATFWLSQSAGAKVTESLASLAVSDTIDREVREAAVFGLSQRRQSEGVPALIKIARSNRDPELRKKALFWLGQSGDPRAIALFEEILSK